MYVLVPLLAFFAVIALWLVLRERRGRGLVFNLRNLSDVTFEEIRLLFLRRLKEHEGIDEEEDPGHITLASRDIRNILLYVRKNAGDIDTGLFAKSVPFQIGECFFRSANRWWFPYDRMASMQFKHFLICVLKEIGMSEKQAMRSVKKTLKLHAKDLRNHW